MTKQENINNCISNDGKRILAELYDNDGPSPEQSIITLVQKIEKIVDKTEYQLLPKHLYYAPPIFTKYLVIINGTERKLYSFSVGLFEGGKFEVYDNIKTALETTARYLYMFYDLDDYDFNRLVNEHGLCDGPQAR